VADVLTTEFVSAEGIFRRNDGRAKYLDFDEIERPIGVQPWCRAGQHGRSRAPAQVIDWVRPRILRSQFRCPVNKVVAKNAAPRLLKIARCWPLSQPRWLALFAPLPVTARFGSVGMQIRSMRRVLRESFVDAGIAAITVHGRTPSAGYVGAADWDTIAEVSSRSIPVIGNEISQRH